VHASGWDTAATQADQVSLPALAVLTESTLSHLGQEGAQSHLIEATRLWQAVGMLVSPQGGFSLWAKGTIRRAGIET